MSVRWLRLQLILIRHRSGNRTLALTMCEFVSLRIRKTAYTGAVRINRSVVTKRESLTLTFFVKIEHEINECTAKDGEHDRCKV